jgi:hypothetical protein
VHFKPDESWDVFLDAQNLLKAETVCAAGQQRGHDAAAFLVHERSRSAVGVRYRSSKAP